MLERFDSGKHGGCGDPALLLESVEGSNCELGARLGATRRVIRMTHRGPISLGLLVWCCRNRDVDAGNVRGGRG